MPTQRFALDDRMRQLVDKMSRKRLLRRLDLSRRHRYSPRRLPGRQRDRPLRVCSKATRTSRQRQNLAWPRLSTRRARSGAFANRSGTQEEQQASCQWGDDGKVCEDEGGEGSSVGSAQVAASEFADQYSWRETSGADAGWAALVASALDGEGGRMVTDV